MLKYREDLSTTSEQSMPADADPDEGALPAYMSLAAHYDLEDEMTIGASDAQKQTVEQEYQAYITAFLSPKEMSILKFWEVGGS
jgi:hypothetical protein